MIGMTKFEAYPLFAHCYIQSFFWEELGAGTYHLTPRKFEKSLAIALKIKKKVAVFVSYFGNTFSVKTTNKFYFLQVLNLYHSYNASPFIKVAVRCTIAYMPRKALVECSCRPVWSSQTTACC
jgi:hypothetical protein